MINRLFGHNRYLFGTTPTTTEDESNWTVDSMIITADSETYTADGSTP